MLKKLRSIEKPAWYLGLQAVIAAGILILFYILSVMVPVGLLTWALSSVFLSLIAVTCLVRANDIPKANINAHWQVRRLGFVMSGCGAVALIVSPLTYGVDFPSWKEVLLHTGVAFVWLTTPHLPPWWRYVSGQFAEERRLKRGESRTTAEQEVHELLKTVKP